MYLRDVYHTPRLSKQSVKYCRNALFKVSPTYYYLHLSMRLCASPVIWQQFIEKAFENMPNCEGYKAIMDDIITFSPNTKHKQYLEIIFITLVKYGLWLSPHKFQFFRTGSCLWKELED